jgi:hypothetical protein
MRLPVPVAQRPLTLPSLILAPQAEFQVDERPNDGAYPELDLSVTTGITDDLAVHALVAPLELSSPHGSFRYGETNRNAGPGAGVAYRFVRGTVELAFDLSGAVDTLPGIRGGSVTPSLELRVHPTSMLRLDVAPAVTFAFESVQTTPNGFTTGAAPQPPPTTTTENVVRLSVPVALRGNLTQSFDLGVTTGLTIYDTSQVRTSTGIPLGVLLGYVVPGAQGPLFQIAPFFDFPYFYMPGRASQTSNMEQYQVGLTATGYLYL